LYQEEEKDKKKEDDKKKERDPRLEIKDPEDLKSGRDKIVTITEGQE